MPFKNNYYSNNVICLVANKQKKKKKTKALHLLDWIFCLILFHNILVLHGNCFIFDSVLSVEYSFSFPCFVLTFRGN